MSRSGYVNRRNVRGKLHYLCGLPHAGKSTYGNTWVQAGSCTYIKGTGDWLGDWVEANPRIVVAGDDFRLALTGHEYLPNVEIVVSGFIDVAVMALLNRGFDVLVDDTATSEMTLMRYYRMDPDPVPHFVDTPAEECKRRALQNNRPYLLPVIDRLDAQLQRLRSNWDETIASIKKRVEHRLYSDSTVAA